MNGETGYCTRGPCSALAGHEGTCGEASGWGGETETTMNERTEDGELCITFSMDDWRTCTIRDEHQVMCDGRAYRWNTALRKHEDIGECTGCLPKHARFGYVCGACYRRAELALTEWTLDKAAIMRGLDRAVSHDNAGVPSSSEGHIPIPAAQLAYDEIDRLLNAKVGGYHGRLDHWVSTPAGAKNAVRFGRAVTTALRTHELEEKPRRLTHIRCPHCEHVNLKWNPPAGEKAPVFVYCENPLCGRVLTQGDTEREEAVQRLGIVDPIISAGEPSNHHGDFAEPFDPTWRDHEHFDPLTTRRMVELRAMITDEDGVNILGMTKTAFMKLAKQDLITVIRSHHDAA